jgi:lysophospholipase L1-like esterase
MPRYGIKRAIGNLFLTFLSLLITCGAVELGLWIIGYNAFRDLENGRELILQPSPNPDVKYELIPGASGYAWGTQVEINAHGHRGRIGDPATFPGFRIIVLGDSITFGTQLPLEATYAYQMQEMLDKSASEYEVLNFGVGGYDILQEAALLEYRGLTYKPNLVVVGFCLNDVGIASPNLEYIERVQKYKSNLILSSSRLAQFVVNKLDQIRIGAWMEEKNRPEVFARDYAGRLAPIADDESEVHALMRQVSEDYPSHWYRSAIRIQRLRYAFEYLAGLAARERFAVVVLLVPWLVGYANDYPHHVAHEIVKLEARRVGFDVLEVVQDFMDVGMENLRISKRDPVHPNERGHRIIAEKLVRYVYDNPQAAVVR